MRKQTLRIPKIRNEIWLNDVNGYGSTNNKIRRWSNVNRTIGRAMTLTQDGTNGDTITINESGIYSIHYTDALAATGMMGVSKNSSQLTTAVNSITQTDLLTAGQNGSDTTLAHCSVTTWLNSGDVIRAHTDGSNATAAGNESRSVFIIIKVR